MKTYQLNAEEQRKTKCNFAAEIDYTDLSGTAATTKTLTLDSDGVARDVVDRMIFDTVTKFAGGSISALTVQAGYDYATLTDVADAFIDAKSIYNDSNGLLVDAGSIPTSTIDGTWDNTNEGPLLTQLRKRCAFGAQEAYSITALFTATGANLTALTQGRIRFYWEKIRLSDLRNINGL